jgi:fermentation-respiration switch protein FrsA (DUF1100 family)
MIPLITSRQIENYNRITSNNNWDIANAYHGFGNVKMKIPKLNIMTISNDFQYQAAQRELAALMAAPSINAARIAEVQRAIHWYLSTKK